LNGNKTNGTSLPLPFTGMTDVLVVGNGAREHALAWKLRQSSAVNRLLVAPGNGGTASIAENVPIPADDVDGLFRLALDRSVDLTVVGPEVPLSAGLADRFQQQGLAVFGATRAAAQLEWSKSFARCLTREVNVPGPDFKVFSDANDAEAFLSRHQGPIVVKADGLAAGKGALLCNDREEALAAIHLCMTERAFAAAGDTVVLEEFLSGPEVSVFAFCDGEILSPMAAACDYKRALDGDEGPNTGGMGCYTPPPTWTQALQEQVLGTIMQPTVRAMAQRGTPYRGMLYAGLMLSEEGPKLLEFNCRLGDPEAQVVLPLLEGDLLPVLTACATGSISQCDVKWSDDACVGVVLASGGYPGDYRRGLPIHGLDDLDDDVLVFHAGTVLAQSDGGADALLTDGGRVLTVVGRGPHIPAARERAYANIGRIEFKDSYYRRDIAKLPTMAC
jgi:phosphoribosylamine--glycine ligase